MRAVATIRGAIEAGHAHVHSFPLHQPQILYPGSHQSRACEIVRKHIRGSSSNGRSASSSRQSQARAALHTSGFGWLSVGQNELAAALSPKNAWMARLLSAA